MKCRYESLLLQGQLPWHLSELFQTPRVIRIPEWDDEEVKAIYYECLTYQGKRTRVFAYYAIPESPAETKIPAIVLAHGGGGTAFKEWVRLWTKRGYAAIAPDLEGQLPGEKTNGVDRPRHEWSGPARKGVFEDYQLPEEDQWIYHATGAVILAHSFLRSFDEVDNERIGVTGISWGGIITCLVAGVDDRNAFAIPVYGCGFLFEAANQYGEAFNAMPTAHAERIKRTWDPSAYFSRIHTPMLWIIGIDDPHFPLHLLSKSYEAAKHTGSVSALSVQPVLGHSHLSGWQPEIIYRFADQMVKNEEPIPQLLNMQIKDGVASSRYTCSSKLTRSALYWTSNYDKGFGVDWQASNVAVDSLTSKVSCNIPREAKACFFSIADAHDSIVCSPLVQFR